MNSLPEQHIDSLPEHKREDAYLQFGMVCAFRSQGLPENEVADKAKFSSDEDMYFRLERWGLSGLLPLREDLKKVAPEDKELPSTTNAASAGKRKAKKFGEKVPLPLAEGAIDKFKGTLELLIKNLDKLRGRDEYLQSKRFGGQIDRDGNRLALGAGQVPPELGLTRFREPIRVKRSGSVKGVEEDGQEERQALLA